MSSTKNAKTESKDRIRIRRSSGIYEWVTAKELELLNERKKLAAANAVLQRQRVIAFSIAGLAAFFVLLGGVSWLFRNHALSSEAGAAETLSAEAAIPVPEADAPIQSLFDIPPKIARPAEAGQDRGQAAQRSIRELPPTAVPVAKEASVAGTDVQEAIKERVRAWARAWSRQDVESYLRFYSSRFQVPDGLSRPDWEKLRRKRLRTPEFIEVEVEITRITAAGSTATAFFRQRYRSPTLEDRVSKRLDLVYEDENGWRILAEVSLPS